MAKKLAMIHTVASLPHILEALSREIMPEVEVFHIVDESLLRNTIRWGKLVPQTYRRLCGYVVSAQEGGADAILVTCSSIGPIVDVARYLADVPVLRIDEAMADRAVEIGRIIGVIATLPTTLVPTTELVKTRAAQAGRTVEVRSVLCEGAFETVTSGDTITHDRIVGEKLRDLMRQVDVVVLAQASMARVADALPQEEVKVPILSSPRLGLQRARQVLLGGSAAVAQV